MRKEFIPLLMVIVLTNCIRTNSEWKSLIVDNSLEGWHIFKDVESTRGWIVENNIFIFNHLHKKQREEIKIKKIFKSNELNNINTNSNLIITVGVLC